MFAGTSASLAHPWSLGRGMPGLNQVPLWSRSWCIVKVQAKPLYERGQKIQGLKRDVSVSLSDITVPRWLDVLGRLCSTGTGGTVLPSGHMTSIASTEAAAPLSPFLRKWEKERERREVAFSL